MVVSLGRSVIIVELWRSEVARSGNLLSNFCVFFWKNDPLQSNFQNSVSFHRLTDRRCCVQISYNVADWKSAKSCVRLFAGRKHKISPASQTLATARIEPNVCQGQSPTMCSQCSRFHRNRFTFGGVIAERVNTAKLRRKVNSIFGRVAYLRVE